jgi:hypothetical protein
MLSASNKTPRFIMGTMAAFGLLAFSAAPASANPKYRHHGGVKHVNVKVNIGGGHGYRHNRYYPAKVVYVAPPRRACTRIRRDGWYNGYPALVSNRICYNGYGEAYVQRGSKRLVHYY